MTVTLNTDQRQEQSWNAAVSIQQAIGAVERLLFEAWDDDPQQVAVEYNLRNVVQTLQCAKRALQISDQIEGFDVRMY